VTETTDRIRWKPTRYGGWTGHVGTVGPWVFQVYSENDAWWLSAQIPGVLGAMISTGPDGAKAEAERLLERFVSSLGAVFPDEDVAAERGRLRAEVERLLGCITELETELAKTGEGSL
jgi:hypothetical protein